MKFIKRNYIRYFLLFLFTFSLASCASKKIITTNKKGTVNIKSDSDISKKNLLYIVDGKEVPAASIKEIVPNDIETITVIKGEKEVAKYTDKKYDGIIIIKMKKKF